MTTADAAMTLAHSDADASAKRIKVAHAAPTLAFELELDHTSSFRQLVDVVGGILKHIEFTLTPHPTQSRAVVLSVDAINPEHVCMVQSRITCAGTIAEKSLSFCVANETLNTCLRNIDRHNSLRLSQVAGTSRVDISSFDGATQRTDLSFELNTLDDMAETADLGDLDFNHEMNVSISKFRGILKLAKDLHCDDLTIELYGDAPEATTTSPVQRRILRIKGQGDASFTRTFRSAVKSTTDATGTTVAMEDVDDDVDVSTLTLLFSSTFFLSYLTNFLKNMEQPSILMKMEPKMPLLMHYDLGVPDSFVRFVLCPRVLD